MDVFHFDFQQNLPTPKLTVGKQFYLRLLWTFLFGIYSAFTRILTAYMWNELVARRGANDVVSCLYHFITKQRLGRTGAKWSIWWADNCPGQNKNNCVIWFFQELIRSRIYSRIDYKFLVVGHTYGPTDRKFGNIEKYLRRIETVYIPEQWYEHVEKSSTHLIHKNEVVRMEQRDFRHFYDHLKQMYTERSKDVNNKPIEFKTAVWFNFGWGEKNIKGKVVKVDHPRHVWVRHTYDVQETPIEVCYFKKRGGKQELNEEPPCAYDEYPLAINPAKREDLQTLAKDFLPRQYRSFYDNIPAARDD